MRNILASFGMWLTRRFGIVRPGEAPIPRVLVPAGSTIMVDIGGSPYEYRDSDFFRDELAMAYWRTGPECSMRMEHSMFIPLTPWNPDRLFACKNCHKGFSAIGPDAKPIGLPKGQFPAFRMEEFREPPLARTEGQTAKPNAEGSAKP